jgi:GT2 family glycosyltransferase
MVTYARDHLAPQAVAQVAKAAGDRRDIEFVLVDNNIDAVDRSAWLGAFDRWTYVKLGSNKGVPARNDGAYAADGRFIVFVDDDAFLNPVGAFDVYEAAFAEHPKAAIVTARHRDADTGETPRASFPHTDKSLPKDQPFKTFRFQGNGFAMRRDAFEAIGPMSDEFFYGLEEIDYAFRVVEAGYEIIYEPRCWVLEHNDPGGRKPKREVEEMRLTNKLIITYKYLPWQYVPLNMALYSGYVTYLNGGRINVPKALWKFGAWVARYRDRRRPLGAAALQYIESCGGQAWK